MKYFFSLIVFVCYNFSNLNIQTGSAKELKYENYAMHEGWISSIEYKTWNGSNWKADLENIHWINGPGGVWNVSDPDFRHHGSDDHNADIIDYLSDIGEKWRSKCHAHSNLSGDVWFTFEHFREGNENDKHEDNIMNFQDWDGKKWQIFIPSRNVNETPKYDKVGTTDPKEIVFYCKRIY